MSVQLITPDPHADEARVRRLRKMRTLAVSLLILAAVVYLLTLDREGFWGYVNAGAEASMVGAIADWFAVTALFKHPLGLPIPHTALVPRRKDEFGKSLEEFFAENFLQEEVIRERIELAAPAQRLGDWLSVPENAERVVREGSSVARIGLSKVRDQDVEALVSDVLIPRLVKEPIAPILGNLLQGVLADDAHHGLVDLALDEAHRWLVHNGDTFTEVLGERAPWWAPERLNEAVTNRLHLESIRWVADIRADPHHHARYAIDSMLKQLSGDLLTNPSTQERAERLKVRVLEQPELLRSGMAVFDAFRRALSGALEETDGPLQQRARAEVVAFGAKVGTDTALRERMDAWVADLSVFVVRRYGGELTAVITHTIQRWDGKEAARKIELHVGPDLQFIRINGTMVGGLVGVLIHAISEVVR